MVRELVLRAFMFQKMLEITIQEDIEVHLGSVASAIRAVVQNATSQNEDDFIDSTRILQARSILV